jgi:5-methylthioribose kinase
MTAVTKVPENAYELLTPETISSYLDSRPALAGVLDMDAALDAHEIGDGNLNLVFLVRDRAGSGLVLKQALPYARVSGPASP